MMHQKNGPAPLFVFCAILGYSFYLFSNFIFMILFSPFMFLFLWNRPLQYRVAGKIFRTYCHFLTRVYLPALNIYTVVEQSGFDRAAPAQPVIFVANHRSRMDGPFLIPLLPDTGIIIKSSYARFPLYSNLVRYLNFISVDPHSIDSLADAMQQCKKLLAQGRRLLVFPEGTRASGARLNVFKDLAFRLSIETNTAIIPVVVHTDLPFMAKIKGSLFPARKMAVVIRALAPLYCRNGERPADFADRVRKTMAETLRQLDSGTLWERLPSPKKNATSVARNKKPAYEPTTTPREELL